MSAENLSKIVGDYLDARDDVAGVERHSDPTGDTWRLDVTGQGGNGYVVTITPAVFHAPTTDETRGTLPPS